MSPPIDLGRHLARPARDPGLQRVLVAPVLAAASVALCGLAADRTMLLSGPPSTVAILFAAIVAGSAFAAGLFAGRRSLPVSLVITVAALLTAALLLRRVVLLRAADPRLPSLPPRFVAAALAFGGLAGVALAALGGLVRRRRTTSRR